MSPIEYALWGLALFLHVLWWFSWFLHIVSIVYGRWKLHRPVPPISPETPLAGVSVIKPLSGVDANLYDNLETYFKLDFPSVYELLFCVEEDSDPACMVVESLKNKYPKVDVKLLVGEDIVGPNPKINNMYKGYKVAKYDLVLVSDAGIRMKTDTLTDLVLHMTDDVGLVYQLPFVCQRKGFAALLEMVYFGTHPAKMCLACNVFSINCTTGMSCLMRKDVLDAEGGLQAYGKYLAEDYFFSDTFKRKGYRRVISTQPALQNPGNSTVPKFQERFSRWAQLRAATSFGTRLEIISECMAVGLIGSWAAMFLYDVSPISFFLVHVLVWSMLDFILLRYVMLNAPLQCSNFDLVVAWLFRELTSFYLLAKAHYFTKYVQWRSKTFRLHYGGTIEEIRLRKHYDV